MRERKVRWNEIVAIIDLLTRHGIQVYQFEDRHFAFLDFYLDGWDTRRIERIQNIPGLIVHGVGLLSGQRNMTLVGLSRQEVTP